MNLSYFLSELTPFGYFVIIVNVSIIGFVIYRVLHRGGFKNAAFNARVRKTIGEAQGSFGGGGTAVFKVHVLDRDGESLVGLECKMRTLSSFEFMTVSLTHAQARQLSGVLQKAVANESRAA